MINLATKGILGGGGGTIIVTTRIVYPIDIDVTEAKKEITLNRQPKRITISFIRTEGE
jgi:hypothetical protein